MPNNENAQKRPLSEVLEEAVKNAMQSARFEDRTINPTQYEILEMAYESLASIIDGEARINLHPAFASGGITIVTEDVSLSGDEVTKLRSVLAECSTLCIEPLANGNLEIGVTVPNVFCPLD